MRWAQLLPCPPTHTPDEGRQLRNVAPHVAAALLILGLLEFGGLAVQGTQLRGRTGTKGSERRVVQGVAGGRRETDRRCRRLAWACRSGASRRAAPARQHLPPTRASLGRYLRPERSKSMPSSASFAATSSLSGGTSAPGASTARRATDRRGTAACCGPRQAVAPAVQGLAGAAGRVAAAARMAAVVGTAGWPQWAAAWAAAAAVVQQHEPGRQPVSYSNVRKRR